MALKVAKPGAITVKTIRESGAKNRTEFIKRQKSGSSAGKTVNVSGTTGERQVKLPSNFDKLTTKEKIEILSGQKQKDDEKRNNVLNVLKDTRQKSNGRVSQLSVSEKQRINFDAPIQGVITKQTRVNPIDPDNFLVQAQNIRTQKELREAQQIAELAEERIDEFNKKYGGKSLSKREFEQAQKEQAGLKDLISKTEKEFKDVELAQQKTEQTISKIQSQRIQRDLNQSLIRDTALSESIKQLKKEDGLKLQARVSGGVKVGSQKEFEREASSFVRAFKGKRVEDFEGLGDIAFTATQSLNPYSALASPNLATKGVGVLKSPFFLASGFASGVIGLGETFGKEFALPIPGKRQAGATIRDPSRISAGASVLVSGIANLPKTLPQSFKQDPITTGASLFFVGKGISSFGRASVLKGKVPVPVGKATTTLDPLGKSQFLVTSTQRMRIGPKFIGKEFEVFTRGIAKPVKLSRVSAKTSDLLRISGPSDKTSLVQLQGAVDDFIGGAKTASKKGIKIDTFKITGESQIVNKGFLNRLGFGKPKLGSPSVFESISFSTRVPKLPKGFAIPENVSKFFEIPRFTGVGQARTTETLTRSIVKQGDDILNTPTFVTKTSSFRVDGGVLSQVQSRAIGFKPLPVENVFLRNKRKLDNFVDDIFAGSKGVKARAKSFDFARLRGVKQPLQLKASRQQLQLPEFAGTGFVKPPITDGQISNILSQSSKGSSGILSGASGINFSRSGTGTLTRTRTGLRDSSKTFSQTRTKSGLVQLQEVKLKPLSKAKEQTRQKTQTKQLQRQLEKQGFAFSGKQKTGTTQGISFGFGASSKQAQKQLERQRQQFARATAFSFNVSQKQKQLFSFGSAQKLGFKEAQKQITPTITKFKESSPFGGRGFNFIIPKTLPKRFKSIEEETTISRPTGTYNAYVRKDNNSKWVKATKKPQPYNRAFNQGLFVADNTTAASVKVKRASKKDLGFDDPFIASDKFGRRQRKTKVPGEEVIFVEKNKFRIDTLGEKQGLKASKFLKRSGLNWEL